MSDEIQWACMIEAKLSGGRELTDEEIDAFYEWDQDCAVGMRSGRCLVLFDVTGTDPGAGATEGYRRWLEVAPADATVDLVEIMTKERQGADSN